MSRLRFTATKEGGKNDYSVYLDFGCFRNAFPIPHVPVETAKGCTRFCESGVHFVIHDDRLREGAMSELFYLLLSLSLDGDVGLDVWFSRRWLVHHFCFVLMVRPKLSQATENLSTVLHVGFGSSVLRTVVGEQKLVDDFSLHLDLSLKLSEVEDRAVSAVSKSDSNIRATKCIKQHRRKYDAEKSGGQDTSLLNPICDGKGYGAFSVVFLSCIHAIMKLSNDSDEFFGETVFCHDSRKAVSADRVRCLCQINISRVEMCSVPETSFAAVLQQTPRPQSQVHYRSCMDFPVRVHVQDSC